MKTFPQCDGTEVKRSQSGRRSASSALKKEASWIPFIQVGLNKRNSKIFSPNTVFCKFSWAARRFGVCQGVTESISVSRGGM